MLYQDQFEVTDVGKKFDKVSRLHCRLTEETDDMKLDMDVNSDLLSLNVTSRFTFALAHTLALDGSADSGVFDQSGAASLLDQYDYVMYGKLYKWKQESPGSAVELYVSCGGLLMRLKGDARRLSKLELDSRVYLLVRKV